MSNETADRLAIRVLDDVTQRLRREAESQDNLSRAAELNRLALVLEELRREEENLVRRGFEKPDGCVCEQNT